MAQNTTTLTTDSGASYVYDVFMSDTQEGIFGADITPDSVLEMSFQSESEATSEPIEKGGFASFYKTNSPETVSLVFSFSSDDAKQNNALDKIKERKENYDLISILTPTHLYENMTILSYSYNRTNTDGMTMLVVTHEMDFARNVSNKVLFMADGVVLEDGTPEEVLDNPKNEKTKHFLSKLSEN